MKLKFYFSSRNVDDSAFIIMMMAKTSKKNIDLKLNELDSLSEWQSERALNILKTALAAPQNLMVAKAARICSQQLLYDFTPELISAYQRFLDKDPLKHDKNCLAKAAIIKALYELDYLDSEFYLAGLCYQQFEPVWGGSVDTAMDIRCTSAFGLAASNYPRAIFELITLLNDPEPSVRSAAVQAIALLNPFSAEIALRTKALHGDESTPVVGDCLAALLRVEPDYSIEFVASFLDSSDEELREQAALALGESKLESAFQCLQNYYCEAQLLGSFRIVLLRAMALQRHEDSLQFLLSVIENEDNFSATVTVKALAIYRHDGKIKQRVADSIAKHMKKHTKASNKSNIQAIFEQEWQNNYD